MKTYKVEVHDNGNKFWYLNEKRHREDGPAIECASGNKSWHLNGKLHREDGPAIEWTNGAKFWYLNDKLHRKDGPAIEYADGTKFWYLNGVELTQKEFNTKMNQNTCNGKVVVIDGKSYKLQEVK